MAQFFKIEPQNTILCIAVFTSKVSSIGAVPHTMVKSLSRGKFAAVNFYSGKLYQGDLQLM